MGTKRTSNNGIKLIKKSNELIEARYKFDIWETRIFSSVLSQIGREDEDLRVYRIYLRDIIKDFGINNGNAYDLLRDAANSLMNKKFFLDYEGEGAERKKVYHIIRSVDYMTRLIDEGKRNLNEYVDVSVDPDMKPFLLQLKEQFTTYDVRNIIKFKSSYTVRIYELLKQRADFGRRKMDVDYLRKVFDLTDEYPLFANFYQKVIEPAYRDINEHTDLFITSIEKIKESKKVKTLEFHFYQKTDHVFEKKRKSNKPAELSLFSTPEIEPIVSGGQGNIDALFLKYQDRVVAEFGVTPTIFIAELEGKTESQVEQAISVTNEAKKNTALKNSAGFFIEALRKGFTNEKQEKKTKAKKAEEQKAKSQNAKEAHLKAIREKIRELTTKDPSVTEKAIQRVLESKSGQFRLKVLGLILPTLDDFRTDAILRDFVQAEIIQMHKADFEHL